MKYEVLSLQAGKYRGTLTCYEYEESPEMPVENRPAMLVLPGGGYGMCSDREAEPVAVEFFNRGYNAYVLRYPVVPERYPAQLAVAAAAMDTIRKRASSSKTNPAQVFAVGFSAGGHLCGTLANCPPEHAAVQGYDFKPNGVVLCYPVITDKLRYQETHVNLLGKRVDDENAWLNLDESVRADNPPAFIWTTANDAIVPALNAIRYAAAYAQKEIRYELHVFPDGPHGMSVCDVRVSGLSPLSDNKEVAHWLDFADAFLRSL